MNAPVALELIPDPRADLRQARVDVGAQARVRDVLDISDEVPVLVELVAEAARLAEVEPAAWVNAANLRMVRTVVDGAAELALERERPYDKRRAIRPASTLWWDCANLCWIRWRVVG